MNLDRRVLVVARHYWPTTTDQTLRLRAWTEQLERQGWRASVVTPRWHASWPRRVACKEIPIFRLDAPPPSEFRSGRYGRLLASWIHRELASFTAIYCDAADSDAHAILSQLPNNHRVPVIVRFDPRELASATAPATRLVSWRPSPKAVDACRRASIVLVPNAMAHQQLLAAGLDPSKIHRVADVLGQVIDRSRAARQEARRILANINHDLFVRSQDEVIVCPGELSRNWGIDVLIQALGPLVEEQRSLKLWILGDSIERPRIYEALQRNGLHRLVAMPGSFTDLEQVLQVANLCVLPAPGRGLGWLLPTCLASSLPIAIADSSEARAALGEAASPLCFNAEDPVALQSWVRHWLRNPKPIAQSVAAARGALVSSTTNCGESWCLASLLQVQVAQPS